MGPKELQDSSGQRQERKERPIAVDSGSGKAWRSQWSRNAPQKEAGLEAARLPTNSVLVINDQVGGGASLSLQLPPQRKHQRYQELSPTSLWGKKKKKTRGSRNIRGKGKKNED